ncbi:glycosyltransferase family 4 protein [Algoriphagus sp. SE2]|uniref:glycosyltransferase family 4 protein n=1 Tax=Algoriphagus sp. SE2 TaxID=3141536 RepID=UPI0031CD2785
MKLLFTQDALVNAGAERSHLEILSRFSKEIEVAFVYFYPKHDLKQEYEKAGIRLIFLEIPESYHFRLAVTRLVKTIRKEKPDLLVSSLWRADIITRIASVITGVPLVGTLVNDSYAPIAWKDKRGLKYKMVYWLDRLTARIPKHWIANAQALAESHEKTLGLDKNKISVVYRGRSIPDNSHLDVIASEARQSPKGFHDKSVNQLNSKSVDKDISEKGNRDSESHLEDNENEERGFGNEGTVENSKNIEMEVKRRDTPSEKYHQNQDSSFNAFHFISYGRLLERKGFQDAIHAFSKVLKKYPNCTLTIYGEGPYRSDLEILITSLGLTDHVKLPGKFGSGGSHSYREENEIATPSLRSARNDATTILLENDCFLFPSWYEGFSGALVEAMMAGIPIIASNISMNLEAISPKTALIFEFQNRKQLANQMIFAIEHPGLTADLGKAAREEAIARFDIEKIAKDYEALLFEIKNN